MSRIHGTKLALLLALGTNTGCQVGAQFVDGVAAMTGQGGEIARMDAMESATEKGRRLAPLHPAPSRRLPAGGEAADVMVFLDRGRLLVGTVDSDAALGRPEHGDLVLLDVSTGEEIWRAERPEIWKGEYTLLATQPSCCSKATTRGTASSSPTSRKLERSSGPATSVGARTARSTATWRS